MQTVISKGARGVRTPKPAPRGAQCAALRPNKAAPLATVATGLANSPLAIADELPIEIPEIPDISQVIEAAASSGEISPLIAGAGVAGVAIVGTVIFSLTRGGSGADKIASTTAAQAYQALGAEERAVLVDIRMKSEQKDAGAHSDAPTRATAGSSNLHAAACLLRGA